MFTSQIVVRLGRGFQIVDVVLRSSIFLKEVLLRDCAFLKIRNLENQQIHCAMT